jgi:GTP:adenosylcobinamide-phosphate guanylyltransferase
VEIKKDEIKEVKKLGTLNGSEVKLVTLKGGFHIGLGKKAKNSKSSDILAVGSHPALVSHQISKKFNDKFEQTMSKNEGEPIPFVKEYSHNLSSADKVVLGLNIFAIKKNEEIEFKITKHNFEIFSIQASENGGEITLKKTEKNAARLKNLNKKEISKNLEKTIKEYAKENSLIIKENF